MDDVDSAGAPSALLRSVSAPVDSPAAVSARASLRRPPPHPGSRFPPSLTDTPPRGLPSSRSVDVSRSLVPSSSSTLSAGLAGRPHKVPIHERGKNSVSLTGGIAAASAMPDVVFTEEDVQKVDDLVRSLLGSHGSSSEEVRFDKFLVRYSRVYSFHEVPAFLELLKFLIKGRLLNGSWMNKASRSHKLRVLQCLRVLTRDYVLLSAFAERKAVTVLVSYLTSSTEEYAADDPDSEYLTEMLVEMTSIVKRLAGLNSTVQDLLFDLGVQHTLTRLLYTKDPFLLHAVLSACSHLATSDRFLQFFGPLQCIEQLLQIVREDDISFKLLGALVLRALSKDEQARKDIHFYQGLEVLVGLLDNKQLSNHKEELLVVVMDTLANLSVDSDGNRALAHVGVIPQLLHLIRTPPQDEQGGASASGGAHAKLPHAVVLATCSCLAALSMDGNNALTIRRRHGIYTLGQLLCQYSGRAVGGDEEALEVQCYAMRTLRVLYSVERNRSHFKKLFPPDLFGEFIDVGNYVQKLKPYRALVESFNKLPWSSLSAIIAAFEELKSTHSSSLRRKVHGYILQEILGKGAFGTVYQAIKEGSATGEAYAIKELKAANNGVIRSSAGDEELTKTAKDLYHEVDVLKELHHPNIVRYYESFLENNHLYIVMELVDGTSLLDHLTSLSEKGRKGMDEDVIWVLFVQLCSALSYMHLEKRVVHRDLHPSNVLLDRQLRAKITDFGLARQRRTDTSVMKSVVGTISYSCPEIVKHEPYTEKADVWSLGCVLYQLATLKPPFSGTNPLTVAQKIVAAKYEPISPEYSPLLAALVRYMLTPEPQHRPSMVQVSAMVAPMLMVALTESKTKLLEREQELAAERALRKRDAIEMARYKQGYSFYVDQQRSASFPSNLTVDAVFADAMEHKLQSPNPSPPHSRTPSPTISPRSSPMMTFQHLVWVCALKNLVADSRRIWLEKFRRLLLEIRVSATLEAEMAKLHNGVDEPVTLSRKFVARGVSYRKLHRYLHELLTSQRNESNDPSPAKTMVSPSSMSDAAPTPNRSHSYSSHHHHHHHGGSNGGAAHSRNTSLVSPNRYAHLQSAATQLLSDNTNTMGAPVSPLSVSSNSPEYSPTGGAIRYTPGPHRAPHGKLPPAKWKASSPSVRGLRGRASFNSLPALASPASASSSAAVSVLSASAAATSGPQLHAQRPSASPGQPHPHVHSASAGPGAGVGQDSPRRRRGSTSKIKSMYS